MPASRREPPSAISIPGYRSSGREAPVTMPRTEFVERRRGAVDSLSKQHSFTNLLLSREGDGIRGRCN